VFSLADCFDGLAWAPYRYYRYPMNGMFSSWVVYFLHLPWVFSRNCCTKFRAGVSRCARQHRIRAMANAAGINTSGLDPLHLRIGLRYLRVVAGEAFHYMPRPAPTTGSLLYASITFLIVCLWAARSQHSRHRWYRLRLLPRRSR